MKTYRFKMKAPQSCALLAAIGLALTAHPASAGTSNLWLGIANTSTTTNWSDVNNWNPSSVPSTSDVAIFDSSTALSPDALTINNVVDTSTTVAGLSYTNTSTTGWQVTQISAPNKLTVTTNFVAGGVTADNIMTLVSMIGDGTFEADGNSFKVGDAGSSSSSVLHATLDMSGLSNFVYNARGGTWIVAGSGGDARGGGLLNFANLSNNVTVGTINFNTGTGNNSGFHSLIQLGGGTNIMNVGTFILCSNKAQYATVQFNPTAPAEAGFRLRGVDGNTDDTSRVNLALGERNNTGSANTDGEMLLNGHPVDIKANTIMIGEDKSGSGTSTHGGVGVLQFDTGIVDATNIIMGNCISSGTSSSATGTLTVGTGGTLLVSPGGISIVNQTHGTATGNLNISGNASIAGAIFKATVAGTANINLTAGSLTVAANIGTASAPIDNFSISDSGLTLPVNLTPAIFTTTLTASGTTNTINTTSVPQFFSYPAQFPVISYVAVGGDNTTFVAGTIAGGFSGYISNNVNSSTIDLVITNGPPLAQLKSITWTGNPTGDWTTNATVLDWVTNGLAVNYNQGDTVTFNDSLTGTTNVNLTMALTPSALTVNNSASSYLFTGTGSISGNTALTKSGSGTLILDNSGNNNFIGGVTITAGTLQVGNNDANGNLPAAASWDDEGVLAFDRSDTLTISTPISGAGSLVKLGNGKLNLNAAETYTGNTAVEGGTLALTSTASLASTQPVFAQGGAFDVSATASFGTVNPIVMSNGTFIVDANNIFLSSIGTTNSTIRLAANASGPSIFVSALTSGGATNYINIIGVQNVPDSSSLPVVIPIISYSGGSFTGPFNFGVTNFPNAYVTNDTTASSIDLVLTAVPYVVTWNGGSLTDNNWSDSNNWSGIGIFPNDSLFFDGSARLSPVNDTAAGTTYSNITFNATASPFTLTGNSVALTGGVFNNSSSTQSVELPITFNSSITLAGTSAPLVVGGGLTNTLGAPGSTSVTLTGTGILTNLFGSQNSPGGTNQLVENDAAGNWTLFDNASSTPITVPWVMEVANGTLNFGSATSGPNLTSTSAQGVPQDNQVGSVSGANATLNFSNGVFTTSARLNTATATGGSTGTINQFGGTINIASQFQGANQTGGNSFVNLYGNSVMNIGGTNGTGTFYNASRGPGVLTITNSASLNCGLLDVSRSIISGITGTVNLDGGTLTVNNVTNASANSQPATTGSTGVFNFNGGILRARANSAGFFEGRDSASPVVPLSAIVQAGGAIIDSSSNSITFREPLTTDPNLGGAPDGGLTKLGTGTLTLATDNTYVGNTTVAAGTLLVDGVQGPSLTIVSNSATLGGNGVIGSNVVVYAGGALAPGDNAVGALTVAGDVRLDGTTTMEIDKVNGTNDVLISTNVTPSTITYGGTLNLPVIAGSVAISDSFKLFSASNYIGSFSAVTPAFPGPGMSWNTNNLNIDGTVSVVAGGPTGPTTNATITRVTLSGGNLLIHGTNNNVPNTGGHYVVLTSTNLATPLTNWTPVATNSFNSDGTFDYSSPITTGVAHQFIDVQEVP